MAPSWQTIHAAAAGETDLLRLLGGLVAPRPLVLVSTVGPDGRLNLAPFSMLMPLAARPPLVGLAIHPRRDGARKATLLNARRTGEMVLNGVTPGMLLLALGCGGPGSHAGDGVALVPSMAVAPPRLLASPAHLECLLCEVMSPAGTSASLVVARVEELHVADDLLSVDCDPTRHLVGHLGLEAPGRHLFWTGAGLVRGWVANGGPARVERVGVGRAPGA